MREFIEICKNIFENLPDGAGAFIEAAGKFVNSNAIGYAAKGIELITPAVAANLVENEGKFNSKSVEQLLESEFTRRGLRKAGKIVLNKDSVKILESMYDELVPKLSEIIKTMRGMK